MCEDVVDAAHLRNQDAVCGSVVHHGVFGAVHPAWGSGFESEDMAGGGYGMCEDGVVGGFGYEVAVDGCREVDMDVGRLAVN